MPPLFGTPTIKSKDITMLESVQKFGCKVCIKQWDTGYDQLLQLLDLPTLARRRLYIDLCTMYKIVHGLVYSHLISL